MASETFAKKNEKYWNHTAASTFKEEWVKRLQAQIQNFLMENTEWLALQQSDKDQGAKSTARLLDYACGGGIVSRALQPYFSQCVGVDLAEGMLAKYRETAAELGLSEQQMRAVRGNLLAPVLEPTEPPTSDEELSNFDLVAISMALHHVDDIELAMKRLAGRLRPGGVLLVIDWAEMDGVPASKSVGHTHGHSHEDQQGQEPHPGVHTMSHDSFTKEQIVSLFQKADCNQSSFVLAKELSDVPPAATGKMQMFFARAMKL